MTVKDVMDPELTEMVVPSPSRRVARASGDLPKAKEARDEKEVDGLVVIGAT